jgi:hypothetical protein
MEPVKTHYCANWVQQTREEIKHEGERKKKNIFKDNAHTFSHTTHLDYATLETISTDARYTILGR